jgi:hypothetical protein
MNSRSSADRAGAEPVTARFLPAGNRAPLVAIRAIPKYFSVNI